MDHTYGAGRYFAESKGLMIMKRERTIYFVDQSVQGSLMLRFVGYWVLCLAIMFGLLAACPIILAVCFPFGQRPSVPQIVADTWGMFWPAMAASLLILPAVLWDLMRMSNRFVGPVYRLRRSMRALADGENVDPVKFRAGDFWFEFAEDFNRVAAASRSGNSTNVVLANGTTAPQEASPETSIEA